MATYSITAIVTKIDSANKVSVNGVGKHRYEKSKEEFFNLLENTSDPQLSKILKPDTVFSIAKSDAVQTTLLAMAMLNKKPLKLTIDYSSKQYTITDIEVP